jgi:hypothetical protein
MKNKLAISASGIKCQWLDRLVESIEPLYKYFDIDWYVCGDATCNGTMSKYKNVTLFPDIQWNSMLSRYANMSRVRNVTLRATKQKVYNYTLILNLDIYQMDCIEGIRRMLVEDGTAYSSYILYPATPMRGIHAGPFVMYKDKEYVYYDTLALQIDKTRWLWRYFPTKDHHGRNIPEDVKFIWGTPPVPFDRWTEVNSAYGPTFYKWQTLKDLEFDETAQECEMQIFHRQMKGKHYIMNDVIWTEARE